MEDGERSIFLIFQQIESIFLGINFSFQQIESIFLGINFSLDKYFRPDPFGRYRGR